jgi:dephospho-CoA kinase
MSVFRVALTGNIASGKSRVAQVWAAAGVPIVDADVLAREAVSPGSAGLEQVRRHFGDEVIAADGHLDRAALRRIVFDDDARRSELESILHPIIARLRAEADLVLAGRGEDLVVHVIPLLFETGLDATFDCVVFVDASERKRLSRLVEHRNLEALEAERMIAAQMPAPMKRERAHIVIDNDGSLTELEAAATAAWHEIERRAGRTR